MREVLKVLARRMIPWNLVAFRKQQLGEVGAILSGDAVMSARFM